MAERIPTVELFRLALIYGEQDRMAMADSWPRGSPEYQQALDLATAFREYRLKHYGPTTLEEDMARTSTVAVDELRRQGNNKRRSKK